MPSPQCYAIGGPLLPRHGENKPGCLDTVRQPWQNLPPQGRFHDHNLLRHCLQPLYLPVEPGVQRKWEDDLGMDALEQALLAMRRDSDFFEANEPQLQKRRRDSLLMESNYAKILSPIKKESKTKNLAPRDTKPQLQSLAATHPSLYRQPSDEAGRAMPPPVLPKKALEIQHAHFVQESLSTIYSWEINCDPQNPTPPMTDDLRLRMLKTDVDPDQPKVISPVYLISLPLGTLVEGACHYADMTEGK